MLDTQRRVHRLPPRTVRAHLQQAVLQVRVPRQPRDAPALCAVRRDAGQGLRLRRLVFGLVYGRNRARAVAQREGVRDGGVRCRVPAKNANAAAGRQHRAATWVTNTSKKYI